ncbi:hypothetical protein [Streptomyces sp. HB132]|nr:hypothetical protein [Streptomyces sp. HB132]MBM7437768.1 hypothetical protein [Streptomyces sp. HB132]
MTRQVCDPQNGWIDTIARHRAEWRVCRCRDLGAFLARFIPAKEFIFE